MPKNEYYLKN